MLLSRGAELTEVGLNERGVPLRRREEEKNGEGIGEDEGRERKASGRREAEQSCAILAWEK